VPKFPKPATEISAVDAPSVSAKGRLSPWAARWHKPTFIAFLVVWVLNVVLLVLRLEVPPGFRMLSAAFPLLACATTLLALGRRLPLQNVLTSACIIASIATGVLAVAVTTGFPFGPIVFNETLGEKIFQTVPWVLPVLWVIMVINGRGVARLIMRPWRKTNFYGFWVIGLTCALVVWFDVAVAVGAGDIDVVFGAVGEFSRLVHPRAGNPGVHHPVADQQAAGQAVDGLPSAHRVAVAEWIPRAGQCAGGEFLGGRVGAGRSPDRGCLRRARSEVVRQPEKKKAEREFRPA
jgi:Carotenoid biosynthesis protein